MTITIAPIRHPRFRHLATSLRTRGWATICLASWTFVLVLIIRVLGALGTGALATPQTTSRGAWSEWVTGTPPADLIMTAMRLAGIAMSVYLLILMTLGVFARMTHLRRLTSTLNRGTPQLLHQMLDKAMGIGLVAAIAVASLVPIRSASASSEFALGPDPMVLILESKAPEMPETSELPAPTGVSEIPMIMSQAIIDPVDFDPVVPASPIEMPVVASETPAPISSRTIDDLAPSATNEWTVKAGDNLWSIAESTVAGHLGHTASIQEVSPYWADLTQENLSRLTDPSNPDLLLVGQTLVLPAAN